MKSSFAFLAWTRRSHGVDHQMAFRRCGWLSGSAPIEDPLFIVWILFTQATRSPVRKYRRIKGQQAFLIPSSVHVSMRWRRELPCRAALAVRCQLGWNLDGLRRNSSPSSGANYFDVCKRPWTRRWSETLFGAQMFGSSSPGVEKPRLELGRGLQKLSSISLVSAA